jgi:hypothetical protein
MISERVCEMPLPEIFKERHIRDIALRFFSFKISWPFRSPAVNRFGKYYFDGSEYMISRINYDALGCDVSRFNGIFLSLSSEFENIEELKAGEDMIQRNIDEFAGVYSRYK